MSVQQRGLQDSMTMREATEHGGLIITLARYLTDASIELFERHAFIREDGCSATHVIMLDRMSDWDV